MFNANYLDLLRRINDLAKRAEQLTQEVNNLISQTTTQQSVQELYQNIENLQNRLLTVQNEVNNVKTSLSQVMQTLFENSNGNFDSLLDRVAQAEQTLNSLQNVVSQIRDTLNQKANIDLSNVSSNTIIQKIQSILDQKANTDLSNVSRDVIRDVINSIQGINAETVGGFRVSQTPAPNTIPVAGSDGKIDSSWLPSSAVAISDQRLQENGYVRFSSGLIIQWGVLKNTQTGGRFTFPISFPNACLSIAFSHNYTSARSGYNYDYYYGYYVPINVYASNLTKSYVDVVVEQGGSPISGTVRIIAIGY